MIHAYAHKHSCHGHGHDHDHSHGQFIWMNKISDDPYSNLVLVDNGSLQPQSPGITQLYIHAYINTTVLKMDVLRTVIQKGMFMENAICMVPSGKNEPP